MSVEGDRRSNSIGNILEENSYQNNIFLHLNRSSANNEMETEQFERRPSDEGRVTTHTCDCFPNCKGE